MALALYRRYRPDTFDGVIGQDQVTIPLMRALDENKLTHAYLFSGPRGCGKTSSARILARRASPTVVAEALCCPSMAFSPSFEWRLSPARHVDTLSIS